MRNRRCLYAGLLCFLAAAVLATCGATPAPVPTPTPLPVPAPAPVPTPDPVPDPQPVLPNVTLTLEPSQATVTLADAATVLCIAIPEQPSSWSPPGALWTVCMTADKWMAKGVK